MRLRSRDLEFDVLATVREPEALVRRFIRRAARIGRLGGASTALDVERAMRRESPLRDLVLLALLTRSFREDGPAVEPEWLRQITGDDWMERGFAPKTIEPGLSALLDFLREDRTRLDGGLYPVGTALGLVRHEADHLMDAFLRSTVVTIRAVSGEWVAVEYFEQAKDNPFRLEILGLLRTTRAGDDLLRLFERLRKGRPHLDRSVARSQIVDWNLPAGTFDWLLRQGSR